MAQGEADHFNLSTNMRRNSPPGAFPHPVAPAATYTWLVFISMACLICHMLLWNRLPRYVSLLLSWLLPSQARRLSAIGVAVVGLWFHLAFRVNQQQHEALFLMRWCLLPQPSLAYGLLWMEADFYAHTSLENTGRNLVSWNFSFFLVL